MKPRKWRATTPTRKQIAAALAAQAPLECQHVYGREVLQTSPPQRRCIKCGRTVYLAEMDDHCEDAKRTVLKPNYGGKK